MIHNARETLALTRRALAMLLMLLPFAASAAYTDKSLSAGQVRLHYPASGPSACEVILLGVGTAMLTSSYDSLSEQLINKGYAVGILDHNPGEIVKTDAGKFAQLAQGVKTNLVSWLAGTSSSCRSAAHWVVGGHSAGGQAAQSAVSSGSLAADAVFSIDPFDSTVSGNIAMPALYWGFDVTTCYVDKDKAAKAAYLASNSNRRAFVRVAREYSWGPCGYSPKYFHCSFCDSHCPGCTNCMTTPAFFFADLGKSVQKFINAAFYGTWSKSALSFTSSTPVTLFVNGDQP
jgi:hypothetical protein